MAQHYDEYADADPYIVLEWLYNKAEAYRSEQAHIKIAAFVEQLQECELVFDADEYETHQESPFRAFERDDAQEDRFNIFEDYLRR